MSADDESESDISPENVLSILVATDCHLGYAEKDPIRQNDSFNTFEEILQLAHKHSVDMILLGGDLFHENKPSRKTIHKTLSLFRKYCMGDKECQLELLSDPAVNFGHSDYPVVNYQDPNLNIAYPVFSVHGNHDDPTGEGFLSAIDIVSTAGLLNHFGKAESCDNIDISPVLLKKGDTKLALYGLGAMRDERLHRTFILKRVRMLRPREIPDSWFNIFVIHQNRAKHGQKNYIPESFLDEFLDLVIWGHEHECLIDPTWSESAKPFYISQPGSSIATSLSEGESKQKHVGLLQIHKKQFKMTKLELKTVRQFMMDDISLSETGIPDTQEERVYDYLTQKVENMIEEAESAHSGLEIQPPLPLIRLKVEYSGGYEAINPHRFGQKFVDRVANNKDILLFYRKRVGGQREKANNNYIEPDFHLSQANTVKMEDLINEYLNASDESLQLNILSERKLSKALNEFVLKDENDAIPELVKWQVRKIQETLCKRNLKEDSIDNELKKLRSVDENVDENEENEEIEEILRSAKDRTGVSNMIDITEIDGGDDDDIVEKKTKPSRGRGSRGRGSRSRGGRGNKGADSSGDTSARGRSRGRGWAKKVDNTQTSIANSFISTGRTAKSKYAQETKRDDSADSTFSSLTTSKSGIIHLDSDEEENPFDFDEFDLKPSKRQKR